MKINGKVDGTPEKKKKTPEDLPPMDYRPIFVQFVGVRKCRFNPSFAGFHRLPHFLREDLLHKRQERHGSTLPPLEISRPRLKTKR